MKRIAKNKYLIVFSLFIVWLVFFDKNSIIEQIQAQSDLRKLKQEQNYYLTQIEEAKAEREELFTNQSTLEKFAREKYLMKKDNEDVFVIVKDK